MVTVSTLESWTQDTLTILAGLATGTPEELAAVVATLDSVRDALPAVVAAMREHSAAGDDAGRSLITWQTIGDALGVSRQAAAERFGRGLR